MTTIATYEVLRGAYRRGEARRRLVIGLAAGTLGLLALADLSLGPSQLSLREVMDGLLAGPNGADRMTATIIWSFRLPMTFMAILVGAALGIAGLQMQTILANPLASPFTLGFSAAAGFGAALAILFGGALPVALWVLTPLAAFAATLLACALVYLVARLRGTSAEVLVLAGIAVLFLFQSLQSLLQFLAAPEVLQQIVFWLFGSLLKATWTSVGVVLAIIVACVPFLLMNTWRLTALRLGEAQATSLGVNVAALRRRTFVIVALLTAGAVAFVGTIGFIGLIAPHAARAVAGEDQRGTLPLSALAGALLLVSASLVAKIISPGAALPVGIVTAVTGVPLLFLLILRRGAGRCS
jgi:iron complex transport system permease protein